MTCLHTLPVATLSGIGPQTSAQLAKAQILSVFDLLLHLPYRYQDRTKITAIGQCVFDDFVVVEGAVVRHQVKFGKKRHLDCVLQDASGQLTLRFFHFHNDLAKQLAAADKIRCFGQVRGHKRDLVMVHPEYQKLNSDEAFHVEERLTPIYPAISGIGQQKWRQWQRQALQFLAGAEDIETLPTSWLKRFDLLPLHQALAVLHNPENTIAPEELIDRRHPAFLRLAFEELLAQQLVMAKLRAEQRVVKAHFLAPAEKLTQQFLAALPFTLTDAQQRVWQEITTDLANDQAMLRLVQGDVGSGKTVIAALAALQALANGKQVVLMAPTEILAEQHLQQFNQWFTPLGITSYWLSGSCGAKHKRQVIEQIASGEAKLIIGTHALFQQGVTFADLALVIIDEQHRFGVGQRLALKEKAGKNHCVHQCLLSATPIPRTLAMVAYADCDVSQIDELPKGRKAIKTVAIANHRRDEVLSRIATVCAAGQQVYWVCTLITESESLQCMAAEDSVTDLRAKLPELRIGLVHGQMKAEQKDEVMRAFKAGEIDILVATTVVEVGVNVPNATLMVIENAERLGLSQLHQLRGRVGRGSLASFCVLLYQAPLGRTAKSRLDILRQSQDGFLIAKRDLAIRGPGDVLGTEQTGVAIFRFADIEQCQALLPQIAECAKQLGASDPELAEAIIKRWRPNATRYVAV